METGIGMLIGKTIIEISNYNDEIIFTVKGGDQYKMYHSQDCCESVSVEDIVGDLDDLIGSKIITASEDSSTDKPKDVVRDYEPESETWTFYHLATRKAHVTIRWCGQSNGYYSESVDFVKMN